MRVSRLLTTLAGHRRGTTALVARTILLGLLIGALLTGMALPALATDMGCC
jgi:hypothetical protein